MNKTVAIVGSHTVTREAIPWQRTDIDFWLFNESFSIGWPKKCDALFQMHHPAVWKNPLNRNDPNFRKWIKRRHKFPIYMQEQYPEIPASREYPLEALVANLMPTLSGKAAKGYFTSSVAFALALAIHYGYDHILLYGVEMESDTEYKYQRDGVFFWIGLALGRGVRVSIHPLSNLFSEPLYGYEGDVSLNRAHFEERLELLGRVRGEAEEALKKANDLQAGALEQSMTESGGEAGKGLAASTKAYFASIKAQTAALIDLGMFEGAIAEENRYLAKADEMDNAAGVHIFARQEFELTAAQAVDIKAQRQAHMNVLGGQAQAGWKSLQTAVEESQGQDNLEKLSIAYAGAHENYLKAAFEFGRISGLYQENVTLLEKCDELIKAAGGAKAEAAILESKRNGHKRGKRSQRESVVETLEA